MKNRSSFVGKGLRIWIFPAIMLVLVLVAWELSKGIVSHQLSDRFHYRVEKERQNIVVRLQAYEQVLRGAVAFFYGSDKVTRQEWRDYVSGLDLEKNLPGIQGVGFSLMVASQDRSAHERAVRAEGFPGYLIHPLGGREQYSSIIFLEPFVGRNLRAFGYDMYSEPIRREAMDRARDTGRPALSGKVALIQETDVDVQPGFLIYVPVYHTGSPRETLAQRRAALLGFVYSPFRAHDLLESIVGSQNNDVKVELYDHEVRPENLLFDSQPESLHTEGHHHLDLPLEYGGHRWIARFHSRPEFDSVNKSYMPDSILLGGSTLALILYLVLFINSRYQSRLEDIANRLEENEERLHTLIDAMPDIVCFKDGEGRWIEANAFDLSLFQLENVDYRGKKDSELAVYQGFYREAFLACEDSDEIAWCAGNASRREESIPRPDGSCLVFDVIKVPLFNRDGSRRGLVVVGRDITERKQVEETLRESEQHFRTLANGGTALIWTSGLDKLCNYFNEPWLCFTGRPLQRELGNGWAEGVHPDDFERCLQTYVAAFDQRRPFSMEYRLRHADGSYRWLRDDGNPRYDSQGRFLGYIGFCMDITGQKESTASLRLAASVYASSFEGIMITDANNEIVDVNPAFSRITGYTRDEVIGKTPKILASGRQGPTFYAIMWQSLQKCDFWQGEIWNRRKTGEVFVEMLNISVIRGSSGEPQHYIGVFSDISLSKNHEKELDRIAHFDSLTGVPNRRLFVDRLAQAIARSRRTGKLLAICYLDLDGFKPINDQFGHTAGDTLLIEITHRLQGMLREDDTLARMGGDEFVLLFNDLVCRDDCIVALERALVVVAQPALIDGVPACVSASIGVTLYPLDDADADTLIRHADQAMYRAKEAGKNRFYLFDSEQDRQVKVQRDQQLRLREALENGEFILHYQPKVNLVSGEVIGVEALIRWQHPELGLLPPAEFLHHIEGCDLEVPVGEWVIETVLHQMSRWKSNGLNLIVSANVGADQLLKENFSERLRLALERYPEITPGELELEILETAALGDIEQAGVALFRCRELGVRFALDDFGTGYSSLSYFRALPVDILKIDQSFVRDMIDDPSDLNIVENVVRLAYAFKRPVIAEGVETLEHGALLVSLGCILGQGYGIARPMPAEQIPGWIEKWLAQPAWITADMTSTSREDLMVVVAAQTHRNWVENLVSHIENPDVKILTELDPHQCRFGLWYQGAGAVRYGALPKFKAIGPVHDRVHLLGAELIELARDGRLEDAQALLPELYLARDNLLLSLKALNQ